MLMTEKLGKGTTHSAPRSMAKETGNPVYRTLRGLLSEELQNAAIAAVLCSTLAVIKDDKKVILDEKLGAKFTYNQVESLYQPLFYAVRELTGDELNDSVKLAKYIDHNLIPTGFDIILENSADELCDLMIETLENVNQYLR
jgi:hypothetical protein